MKPGRSVLIVEDEEIIRTSLAEFLTDEGYQVATASQVELALQLARTRDFHVAICDVQLPDGDGLGLLRRLQQLNPSVMGLIITAYATVENAVEAFKTGAFDYLVKPVIFDDLANKLLRLFQFRELHLENQALRRELARRDDAEAIVGSSKCVQQLRDSIRRIALTKSNVLLTGESGTGKELVARSIHRQGPNKERPFLAVSCSLRPAETLESQLFGVSRGQIGGSTVDQPGCFRQVGEGTVFLDEVGELPIGLQGKLLRAMEYHEGIALGGTEVYPVDCRIVASSTQDLQQQVSQSEFQEDLFYRLDGAKLRIPPLGERLDDIPELVDFFIAKHSQSMGLRVTGATSETIRLLTGSEWKGNVRQLENAIERAVMMCTGPQIQPKDLPPDLQGVSQPLPNTDDLRSAIRHYERLHIIRVLKQWPDKREAAKRLKLGLSSLYRKIEELEILL